jgi:hypothetical protein
MPGCSEATCSKTCTDVLPHVGCVVARCDQKDIGATAGAQFVSSMHAYINTKLCTTYKIH